MNVDKIIKLKNQLQKSSLYDHKKQESLSFIFRNNFERISNITSQHYFSDLMNQLLNWREKSYRDFSKNDLIKLQKDAELLIKLARKVSKPYYVGNNLNDPKNLDVYFLNRNIDQENRVRRNLIRQLKLFIKELNRSMEPHFYAQKKN